MRAIVRDHEPELFIALETDRTDQRVLQCLTTDVMQWSETIWIMDLSRFYDYWMKQAGRVGLNPLGIWRKLFNHLLGEEPDQHHPKVIALAPAYRACCSRNPWSAVLLLQAMKERDVKGVISLQSKIGQSLFRELTWATWWRQIETIESHLAQARIKGYKQAGFKQQCKRLQMAIPRLDFKSPWQMHILNKPGVKKRFGETLADIWDWTYGTDLLHPSTIYQTRFPWHSRHWGDPPAVRRNLDYPLLLWEQFVPLLVEDFDRLCRATANSGERVTRMDWTLTLETMDQLTIPILFRNPHNLQEEKERHTTSLLQANYGYTAAINQRFPPDPENGCGDTMPLILGWELRITGSLYLPDIVLDIFGEGQERGRDLEILLRLENELPVGLCRFSSQGDWYPEDSFTEEHFVTEEIMSASPELNRSLEALAEERPLYIRQKPLPVENIDRSPSARFLESTMTKWWKTEGNGTKERSYFKQIDPEGNALWVFRDTAGQWYQHGIFG